MSFSINCLEITAKKYQWKLSRNLYKNLLSEEDYEGLEDDSPYQKRYFFNDFYEHNQEGELGKSPNPFNSDLFFWKNINIQAIVGKNGSGKSTLMDLVYVLINNYSCIFTNRMPRSNFYVYGLYANLYFRNDKGEFLLKSQNTKISLYQRRMSLTSMPHEKWEGVSFGDFDIDNYVELNDYSAKQIALQFFYTVVSNYSMLSLIPSSYYASCSELIFEDNKWKANLDNYRGHSWIQRIFHKNDGYTCPIVLNPMREGDGVIDVAKEMQLSKYRLISLLIYAKRNGFSFDDRYELKKIEVVFYNQHVLQKLSKRWEKFRETDDAGNLKPADVNKVVKIVDEWLADSNSICRLIVDKFELIVSAKTDFLKKVKRIALAYLQDKILSLPNYYSYKNFSEGGAEDLEIKDIDKVNKENLEELIKAFSLDPSHVVTKIHQVINFLSIKDEDTLLKNINNEFGTIPYEDYEKAIRNCIAENKEKWNGCPEPEKKIDYFYPPFIHIKPWDGDMADENREFSLDEIIECLPPSVCDYRFYLYDKIEKKEVLYDRMSSGELQLLQTISTHLYHVRNIMSVNGSRLRYENINMVFDELELCYHPEYQRIFVKKLVDIITNLKLNDTHSFNIFLITHSPFVLSDIPPERILYLKDGSMDVETKISSFAGNIGEMFYDSFFLEKTIGAFAEEKIKRLVKIRQGKNPDGEDAALLDSVLKNKLDNEAVQTFNAIGDSIVKCILEK